MSMGTTLRRSGGTTIGAIVDDVDVMRGKRAAGADWRDRQQETTILNNEGQVIGRSRFLEEVLETEGWAFNIHVAAHRYGRAEWREEREEVPDGRHGNPSANIKSATPSDRG